MKTFPMTQRKTLSVLFMLHRCLQPYNLEKKQFMEYVSDYGTYADIPIDTIVAAWKEAYGENRVSTCSAQFEKSGGISSRDFDQEEIWKG
jgi:hypothetical protein